LQRLAGPSGFGRLKRFPRRAALRHPPAFPFFGPSAVRAAFLLAVLGLLLVVAAAAPPAVGQGSTAFFVGAALVQAMAIAAVLAGRRSRLRPDR